MYNGQLNIGCWERREDFAEWVILLHKASRFTVSFEYSCAPNHGGDFVLNIGDQMLEGIIGGTGAWDQFQSIDAGEVELNEGTQTIRVKAGKNFDKALMNLRRVIFSPSV